MKPASVLPLSLALLGFLGQAAWPARAEPPIEERLSAWLLRQDFAPRAAAVKPAAASWFDAGGDLKDAVADEAAVPEPARIAQAGAAARRGLLDELPGIAAQPFEGCRALKTCAQAPLSFRVDSGSLDDAILGLLRPWMLLQAAKGRGLRYRAAQAGGRLMTVGLDGTDLSLAVDAQPLPYGGYEVRLEDGQALAARYKRERAVLLGNRRQS